MTEFHAGDVVGGYRLEARLGGGGFGSVWRARHQDTGRLVAIKLLTDSPSSEDEARLRTDVEILAASAASGSPHVVQVLEGGVSPVPYVVMEFVYGTSLAEELRQRQKLPQEEVIDIGVGIADALRALNEVGIIHRDVKPSNVMIDRNGVVKLADFGIAKIVGFDAATLTGQLPLSISYSAPEVWEGRAQHRSDLYAMAIVLFQCLSGTLPFRGAYAELFYQHRTKEPELNALPEDTAPALVELIERCLRKDPAERLDAVDCLALLTQAREQLAKPPPATEAREPERFGPWLKLEPVPGNAWAWLCEHESSGEEAVVEVHFSATAGYGEGLRRAVAANARLEPWGAERLFGTNRLILRPGEAWRDPPAGAFQFWVAREVPPEVTAPREITPYILLRVVENLSHLVEAAVAEGVPLTLADEVSILPDGALLLRHPGFPCADATEPEAEALRHLRGLTLPGQLRRLVSRATGLDALRDSLQGAVQGSGSTALPPAVEASRAPDRERLPRHGIPRIPTPLLAVAALIALIAGSAGIATLAFDVFGENGGGATISPPPVVAGPPELRTCLGLSLPAALNSVDEACGALATFSFDATCQRGQACKRNEAGGQVAFKVNDRTVAFVDPGGNVTVASEDGSNATSVSGHGFAQQPAWSPDGRYVAYVLTQPLNPGAPPEELRYASQLRLVEVDRPANEGVLLATNEAASSGEWQRLQVRSPQWSPDGQAIYLLWGPYRRPGGSLVRVDLKMRANDVDFGVLRSDALRTETIIPPSFQTIALAAADFGLKDGIIEQVAIDREGHLVVKACDSERPDRRCALGRWDGREARLITPLEGSPAEAQALGPNGEAFFTSGSGGSARLLRPDATGQPEEVARLPQTETAASLAVSRGGAAALVETGSQTLTLLPFGGGAARVWGRGSSPSWFVAPPAGTKPGNVNLRASPFATPTPVPTTTPTATPLPSVTPGAVLQMTLILTVRKGGALLPGASVVAEVGAVRCAEGTTEPTGRLFLSYPAQGAPASCSDSRSQISFRVNNQPVSVASGVTPFYRPQSVSTLDLNVP